MDERTITVLKDAQKICTVNIEPAKMSQLMRDIGPCTLKKIDGFMYLTIT